MNLTKRTGMLKSTASFSPWSVNNVKSNRTDTFDPDTGEMITNIGNDMGEAGVGHTYSVDSTAIQSARFDPSDNSLNIVYKGGGKEYKFAADGNDAVEWLKAPSKGRLTNEWKYTHHYPGY